MLFLFFYQSKFVTRERERARERARERERERECEMLFLFYQSKVVTDTSLIVRTLPGKLRFSKLWSCKISILKLCAHFKLLSPLWIFFFFNIKTRSLRKSITIIIIIILSLFSEV